MELQGMNHFTILAEDVERTCAFYRSTLGLEEGYRPPLGFPGAWLYLDGRAILHVIGRSPLPEPRGGVLDHMAFTATGLRASINKLDTLGIPYELINQVGSRIWQVFFYDPNGAKIELDFAPEEPSPL